MAAATSASSPASNTISNRGPEIISGAIASAGDDIAPLLEYHRKLVREVPAEECALVAALRLAPPAPWLPKEVHGKPIAAVFVCDTGPVAEAEARLKPLKAFRRSAGDICQRRSYASQQSLIGATQPKGHRYYWKSEYLAEITPEFLATYLDHFSRIPSPHTAMALFPLGGALNKLPAGHSPMGNRDAKWVFNLTLGVGQARGRRAQHRVDPRRLARPQAVLDRRHLRQLPYRGRRRRAGPRCLRRQSRAPGRCEDRVGSGESLSANKNVRPSRRSSDYNV